MSKEIVASLLGVNAGEINEPLMQWAWEQRCGGPRQKFLLVILCIFADSERRVHAPRRWLSEITGIKGRTLVSGINALRRLGYIDGVGDSYRVLQPETPPLELGERLALWIPPHVREAVFAADLFQCVNCGSPENLQIDHIVPQSRGGFHDFDNLQTLCGPCNAAKGDLTQEEWDQMRRRPQ